MVVGGEIGAGRVGEGDEVTSVILLEYPLIAKKNYAGRKSYKDDGSSYLDY